MVILFVCNRQYFSQNEAISWFQQYCEEKNLIVKSDIQGAKEFLSNSVITKRKHIDLIVTDWQFGMDNAKNLLSWLRNSTAIYSDDNFQITSIPVLLIEDTNSQSTSISEGFDGTIKDFPENKIQLNYNIGSAIRAWRRALADDLELIGLDPKTYKIYPGQRNSFISYHKLKVLSRKFVDYKSKNLNYFWTNVNLTSLNDANQAFLDKIAWADRTKPRYMEKSFHNFFLENPSFIKGEDYQNSKEQMWYEKHLYINDTRKYLEPDFLNNPHSHSMRFPEIFEIKRHTQKLISLRKNYFLSNALKSFKQVAKYKSYMESVNTYNEKHIKFIFADIPKEFEYTLLMGSQEEKLEKFDLIQKLKSDLDFDEINLVTYHDLLEKHIRMCNQLEEFKINR